MSQDACGQGHMLHGVRTIEYMKSGSHDTWSKGHMIHEVRSHGTWGDSHMIHGMKVTLYIG